MVDTAYRLHEQYDAKSDNCQTEVSNNCTASVIHTRSIEDYHMRSYTLHACEGPKTTLSAIVVLHNIKKQSGWLGNSVTTLLSIMKRWLPKENTLPDGYPKMKRMMKDLGMKENFIHACINNCILFWKDNEDNEQCPQCGG